MAHHSPADLKIEVHRLFSPFRSRCEQSETIAPPRTPTAGDDWENRDVSGSYQVRELTATVARNVKPWQVEALHMTKHGKWIALPGDIWVIPVERLI